MSVTDSINSFRDGLNEWLSVILKLMAIGVIVLAVVWLGISVFANIFENRNNVPEMPSIDKAQYEFIISNAGQVILTDNYDITDDGVYVLHGVYRIYKNKWRYQEDDLKLDEFFFGEIIVKRR